MGGIFRSSVLIFCFAAILIIATGLPVEEKRRYDNFTVYKVTPNNRNALETLLNWESERSEFDFWSPVRSVGIPVDIMVPPKYKKMFEIIDTEDISVKVMMENVQEQVEKANLKSDRVSDGFNLRNYHTLEEIYNWMRSLAVKYRGIVRLINIGKTYEKRDILGVKLSFKNVSQKAVFIESNIHAREWISGATTLYILNELLTSTNTTVRQVAESHDWYILPIANPDGYEYTHKTDRLWRKTRVPYARGCFGSDPNRNWDYQWGHGGTSTDPCSETYQGPKPFSEPCTKALSQYITSIAKELVAYIDFHSFSQLLMVPYGHTPKHLDNYDKMYPVGLKAKAALARRYGTQYEVGNIAETIYVASGSSLDWVKGTHHIPIAFVYELRDKGTHGFLLPASQIIPTGEETFDSVLTILIEGEKVIYKN